MRTCALVLALSALMPLCACSRADDAVPVEELRRDAEQGLRALGKGRFEVLEYSAPGGSAFELVDDYYYRARFYALSFDARVRCTAHVAVADRDELDGHVGEPGWSIDASDLGLALIEVLGAGDHAAGEAVDAHATAIFDEIAPGRFRYRTIDHRR